MTAELVALLGFVAGALTTAAFVPQVVKVWRTRSTRDISLWMWLVLCVGILLWIVYGVLARSVPVVAANVVTLGLATAVLVCKIRYG